MSKHIMVILLPLFFLSLVTSSNTTSDKRIVCYYTNWAQYRPGKGRFVPEYIPPKLCTHIIYAFAKPIGLGMRSIEWNDEPNFNTIGMYTRVQKLKERNPDLTVLLALGDNTVGSYAYIPIVGTPAARLAFAQNAITFLRRNGFDGLDLNWNYPGTRGMPVVGKTKYAQLLQELYNIFETDSVMRSQRRLILSATLPQIKETIDLRYDVVSIAKIADFVSIMTFDFHGSWESRVGLNAPLYVNPEDTGYSKYFSMDWVARYYIDLGVPKDKINIGIPLYGRTFTLDDPRFNYIGSPAKRPGKAGRYTSQPGFLAYYEICDLIKNGSEKMEVPPQHGRYLLKENQWVGYDDVESVSEKACYAKENGFGGVMIRSIDLDDFTGEFCGEGQYPLLSAISSVMREEGLTTCSVYGSFSFSISHANLHSAETRLRYLALLIVWLVISIITH